MNKKMIYLCLALVISLFLSTRADTEAQTDAGKYDFTIRKIDQQTVLYTIYRGDYDQIGPAIGKLYALAGQKQIRPLGPTHYAYLTNPKVTPPQHSLTEIRIPVDRDTLIHSGTLGPMTDVKTIPSIEVAVVIKPKGLADPSELYNQLAHWIHKQDYICAEGPVEKYLTPWTADSSYADMTTEIMLPVKKVPQNKD
jgi:effector-binding domain-containing protein